MSNNLYITGTEARSGKSVVSLGVMEMLLRKIERVGFFRPIIHAEPESVFLSLLLALTFQQSIFFCFESHRELLADPS